MPTLTKATDTPKARKASVTKTAPSDAVTVTKGKATKTPTAPTKSLKFAMSKVDVARFVKACKAESASHLLKIRIAGESVKKGADPKDVKSAIVSALKIAVIPESMASGVSHYCTAYALADSHGLADDDAALGEVYKISHGAVKLELLRARIAEFVPTSEETKSAEFVALCKLIKKTKGLGVTTDDAGDEVPESEDTPTATDSADLSMLSDVKGYISSLKSCLALMMQNPDPTEYMAATELLMQFADDFALIPEMA